MCPCVNSVQIKTLIPTPGTFTKQLSLPAPSKQSLLSFKDDPYFIRTAPQAAILNTGLQLSYSPSALQRGAVFVDALYPQGEAIMWGCNQLLNVEVLQME